MTGGNAGTGNSRCKGHMTEARGHGVRAGLRRRQRDEERHTGRSANIKEEGSLFAALTRLNLMLKTPNN